MDSSPTPRWLFIWRAMSDLFAKRRVWIYGEPVKKFRDKKYNLKVDDLDDTPQKLMDLKIQFKS